MHLQENIFLTLTLYPLHHVTYAPKKFEVAAFNALEMRLQENT